MYQQPQRWTGRSGSAATEYALLVVMICMVLATTIPEVQRPLSRILEYIATVISGVSIERDPEQGWNLYEDRALAARED